MISTITRHTGAKIVVGQNGRVWVNGTPEAMLRVRECLLLIDEEGQRSGLTQRIDSYLASTGSPGEGEGASRGEGGHRTHRPAADSDEFVGNPPGSERRDPDDED